MRQLHAIIIFFTLSSPIAIFVNCISCYKCQSVSSSSNCIVDPGSPTTCDKKYCTIYRQEYLDPEGKLRNFYRSCETKPIYLNAVIRSSESLSYYRSCVDDLCNDGDGIEEYTIPFENETFPLIHIVSGMGSSADDAASSRSKLIPTLIGLAILLPVGKIIQ